MQKPEMVVVPAGKFLYGNEKVELYLPEYQIGKYPVTNGQYQLFIEDTGRVWESPVGRKLEYADHPATFVSYHDAVVYCEWLTVRTCKHYRLPTEQEWEKAARGTDGRAFPWGNGWDKTRCNTSESSIGETTSVGQYSPAGDSFYGCCDMAGNVWEWTASDYDDRTKVVRGGAWYYSRSLARCAYRSRDVPDLFNNVFGFRLVSPVESECCILETGRKIRLSEATVQLSEPVTIGVAEDEASELFEWLKKVKEPSIARTIMQRVLRQYILGYCDSERDGSFLGTLTVSLVESNE